MIPKNLMIKSDYPRNSRTLSLMNRRPTQTLTHLHLLKRVFFYSVMIRIYKLGIVDRSVNKNRYNLFLAKNIII